MAVRYSCDVCGATLVNEKHAVALDAIEEVDDLHQPGGTVSQVWLLCRTCFARVVLLLDGPQPLDARAHAGDGDTAALEAGVR